LNSSGAALTSAAASSLHINPMRVATSIAATNANLLMYNTTTKEIGYSSATSTLGKTFIINHPDDNSRYLIHACLEGPESGVYYRGKGEIKNNEFVKIFLPPYVQKLATDFNVQITPIYSGKMQTRQLQVSEVENNMFTVYGDNTKFYWLVYGKRLDIDVEPLKESVKINGNGPYTWVQ